eukprot:4124319-Amphidinium_carterae.1
MTQRSCQVCLKSWKNWEEAWGPSILGSGTTSIESTRPTSESKEVCRLCVIGAMVCWWGLHSHCRLAFHF